MASTVIRRNGLGDSVTQRLKLRIDDALHNRLGGQSLVGGQHGVAVDQEVVEVGVEPGGDLGLKRGAGVEAYAVEQPVGRTPIHGSEQRELARKVPVQQRTRNAGLLGDGVHRDVLVRPFREDPFRRVHNVFAAPVRCESTLAGHPRILLDNQQLSLS